MVVHRCACAVRVTVLALCVCLSNGCFQMRMCKIVATRKGYKKEGSFTEVMVRRDSEYATVARQAATTIELQDEDDDGGELSLFRVDGTIIPRSLVDVGGREKEWTLERYLRSIGRTASQLKLGVGYRADVCSIDITLQCGPEVKHKKGVCWYG